MGQEVRACYRDYLPTQEENRLSEGRGWREMIDVMIRQGEDGTRKLSVGLGLERRDIEHIVNNIEKGRRATQLLEFANILGEMDLYSDDALIIMGSTGREILLRETTDPGFANRVRRYY